jgi:hypothetical protein
MFKVNGILPSGKCLMCDRQVQVFDIEAPDQKIFGLLCLGDFKKLVRASVAITAAPKTTQDPEHNAR